MSFITFGDSITASTAAPIPSNVWAAQVATLLGLTHINYAIPSSQAADQARLALETTTPNGADVYGIFLGTNDEFHYGDSAVKRQAYLDHLRALIVFASCAERTPAASMTRVGAWDNYSDQGGYYSQAAGATASCPVTGDVAYLCFRNQDNVETAGAISQIKVGTATKGSRTGNGQVVGQTALGSIYGPQVIRVSGLGAGAHTLDVVNAVGGKYTLLDYVTSPVQTSNPDIYVLNLPILSPDPAWRSDYNAGIAALVAELRADGRNIHLVDISTLLVAAHLVDGVHWNISGHNAVAVKFMEAVNATTSSPETETHTFVSQSGAIIVIVTDQTTGLLISQTVTF